MATTNPVSQVLVTDGDQAVLAAGSRMTALANGQIGIFNYHTGLSVDGSDLSDCEDIFLAVGINRTSGGTATAEDVSKSAGQMIQVRNIKSYTFKGYVAEVGKVVDITNFKTYCNTDYALNIEFRSQQIYNVNGFNQFRKSFNFTTGCCDPITNCDDCQAQAGSNVELVAGLINEINADADNLVTASAFGWKIIGTINTAPTADGNTTVTVGSTTYTVAVLDADTTAEAAAKIVAAINTQSDSPYRASLTGSTITIYPVDTAASSTATITVSGSGVTINAVTASTKTAITDIDAYAAAFPDASLGIRLTGTAETRPAFNGGINLAYHKTGTDFIVSFADQGFNACNGTITTVTELQFSEGKGYDLKQQEYVDGGWNGRPGPYRQNAVTGLQKAGFESFVTESANYNQLVISYDQFSVGGWLEYLNNLETVIAVPCDDDTTLGDLVDQLDLIINGIKGLKGLSDAVTENGDCTNVRTGLLTDNGIVSIA